jgi:protein-tyrosine phosphatase
VHRVELHFHLLPGVDDGPADMETSIEMARMAIDDGTGLVTCTPHVRDTEVREIPGRVEELRAALLEARVPLEVRPGAELAFDDLAGMDDDELESIAQGPPGHRWLLYEAPLQPDNVDGFLDSADELRRRGYGLLIGHPERCPDIEPHEDEITQLLAAGDVLQVNATSLVGRHGAATRDRGIDYVRSGLARVIASDAHRPRRGPSLTAALAVLAEAGVGPAAAERLVSRNPRALVERGLPAAPAVPSITCADR